MLKYPDSINVVAQKTAARTRGKLETGGWITQRVSELCSLLDPSDGYTWASPVIAKVCDSSARVCFVVWLANDSSAKNSVRC